MKEENQNKFENDEEQRITQSENELTEEWRKKQRSRWPTWHWQFKHPLHFLYQFVFVEEGSKYYFQWKDLLRFILQALVYIFIMCSIAFIILAIQYFWKNLL